VRWSWGREVEEWARIGEEIISRVFGVNTGFKCMTYKWDGGLRKWEWIPCRHLFIYIYE
jgi:hypothetical protein